MGAVETIVDAAQVALAKWHDLIGEVVGGHIIHWIICFSASPSGRNIIGQAINIDRDDQPPALERTGPSRRGVIRSEIPAGRTSGSLAKTKTATMQAYPMLAANLTAVS